jgi:hypothetical protein
MWSPSDLPIFGPFFANWGNWADKWEDRALWIGAFILIILATFLVSAL